MTLQQASLEEQKAELRKKLNILHDQLIPIQAQYGALCKEYEAEYKQYLRIDTQLAKLDGRFKKCRPHTSGKKPINHGDPTRVLTKEQLELLIKKLEAEIRAKEVSNE